jgi:hypothetical protein
VLAVNFGGLIYYEHSISAELLILITTFIRRMKEWRAEEITE